METGHIAIIGGTGFEELPPEIFAEPVTVETRFGPVQALSLSNNYVEPYKLFFLARHGKTHGLAPHQINYRANIAALVELGVRSVFATNAVGSLRRDLAPGAFVLLDDFLDFTRQRPLSYFVEGETWQHTDFSVPYSPRLRAAVLAAAQDFGISLVERGTYLCCDGPRFETPAEIRLFAHWGADVVGMTGLPEAVFAKEAGLEYAALAIVTNYGAGLTQQPVDHLAVTTAMRNSIALVRELLLAAAGHLIAAEASL
ncbi:MAG TPA: S-methyl-5'-thioinosine phosphorylase [Chthonomonadaceae bacterium]|nr:S-methyl-5'-thioinosine phosphorylase [Chthonomonadaceae bacterium]